MKKFYLLVITSLLFAVCSFSQNVRYYTFTAGSGATLDPMTGATTIVQSNMDEYPSAVVTIPFTFIYENKSFTTFSASPNGLMKLGGSVDSLTYSNSATKYSNVLFPFWDNLHTGLNGSVSSLVTGNAPNRILKVQWFLTVPWNPTGNANSTMQAWLYESTNAIEFRYGAGAGPASGASVGINGAAANSNNDNFISVTTPANTASTTTAEDHNTAWPGAGTIYTFSVPNVSACAKPTTQVTALRITDKFEGALGGYFNAASGAPTGYLVIRSIGAFTGTPANGTAYGQGNIIGNGTVVQSTDATTLGFTAMDLAGNTQYTITVLSYNAGKCSGGPIYNTTTPSTITGVTCTTRPTTTITSLTATSAKLNWTSSLGAGVVTPISYTVAVASDNGFTKPVAGFPKTVNDPDTTENIAGLTGSTTYYYKVSATGTCQSSQTYQFTTLCSGVPTPYTENFDAATVPGLPACTTLEDLNGVSTWETSNSSGNNMLVYSPSTNVPANDWFYTRGVSLKAGTSYKIAYKYGNDFIGYINSTHEALDVLYGTTPSASAMTNMLATHPSIRMRNMALDTINFTPSATNVYYFGFHAYSDADQSHLLIDSIAVTENGAALPLVLSSFNATRNGTVNNLSWLTEQESNTSVFVIERSTDGRNYTTIGQVVAAGNSNNQRNYQFTDEAPFKGLNYYRLKMLDKDGHTKFGDVRSVKNNCKAGFILYPNPAKDVVKVDINSMKADRGFMTITDINGRKVYNRMVDVVTGNNSITVDISNIAKGAYFIKIQLSDELLISKISKL